MAHLTDVLGWQFDRRWPRSRVIVAEVDASAPDDTNMVQVSRTNLWVWRRQWFTAVGGDLPYVVSMLVHFDGQETRCAEARYSERIGGPKVTSTRIRTIRLDDLLQSGQIEHARIYTRHADGTFVLTFLSRDEEQVALRAASKDGRRRTPIEDLEKVALVYRSAIGTHPTAAVERELGLPNRNTAKKWVARARAAGLLEPAPGDRPQDRMEPWRVPGPCHGHAGRSRGYVRKACRRGCAVSVRGPSSTQHAVLRGDLDLTA